MLAHSGSELPNSREAEKQASVGQLVSSSHSAKGKEQQKA